MQKLANISRTWSVRKFSLFLATAISDGREDYAAIACLTWCAGLRIHECIGRNTAYELIRCGKIHSIRINKQLRIPKQSVIDYLSNN